MSVPVATRHWTCSPLALATGHVPSGRIPPPGMPSDSADRWTYWHYVQSSLPGLGMSGRCARRRRTCPAGTRTGPATDMSRGHPGGRPRACPAGTQDGRGRPVPRAPAHGATTEGRLLPEPAFWLLRRVLAGALAQALHVQDDNGAGFQAQPAALHEFREGLVDRFTGSA